MQFKTLQEKIVKNAMRYGKKHKIKINENFSILKLYEEVGELSQAYLIHKKMSRKIKHLPKKESKEELAKELADVVGISIVLAHTLDIDLEEAIDKKWINKEK